MATPEPILPKPGPPRPVPLLGPTAASSILVGVASLAALLDAWATWYRHGVVVDYAAGEPGVWVADLMSAAATSRTAGIVYLLALASAGVALLVWGSRLRANARLLGHDTRRRWRTLAVAGWFGVSLVGVGATLLVDAGTAAELSTLGVVDSVTAVAQLVVGALVIVMIRVETNQRGRAMRG
ncbi:hypothetical protein [Actinophytocola gossypii]|uniref:DUF5671 domain-containing protein n=1 Tax=Actinophytocola gossypii TaxID=2812003 RepID=A0ABT2JCM4_9PSEU|nr:hypothetical protein [Actinophytocola gossypii]MCT2585621.1 hypothetical protein [Actinophytocola gossypii]